MSRNFRFQRAEDFDPVKSVWHVTHKRTEKYVGEVVREGPNNYEVRRPLESTFHGSHATRVHAARWLKNKLNSRVVFEEDVEADGDEESDN